MSRSVTPFPSRAEGEQLHARLRAIDVQAPAAVCNAFLKPLLQVLMSWRPGVDEHLRVQAAEQAVLDYVLSPARFDPEQADLGAYLRMAARRDLLNLLSGESRHHRLFVSNSFVETVEEGGNIMQREQEPPDPLVRDEDAAQWQELVESVAADLRPEDRRVLELMLAGQDDTAACAAALGIGDLPAGEQAAGVKRAKDRIKKRLQRRRSA